MTTGRDTRFKPGNPGRPKGSKNKLQEDVIRDVCTVWEEGGIAALRTLAAEDPGKFVDAAIKLLPKDVNHTVQRSAAELTDEELARIIVEAGSRIGTDEAEGHTGQPH